MTVIARAAVLLLSPFVFAARLPAQDTPPASSGEVYRTSAEGEVVSLAVNAALGGLTAGVLRRARGGSFRSGFATGAAGGAVAHAGKRLAVERWDGAGLLGRELHAAGASIVANAADGRGPLSRIALPVGPVRLHVGDGAPRLTLDLTGGLALAHGLAQGDSRLDWGSTLSAGAPVFYTPADEGRSAYGTHAAGVIRVEVVETEWEARGGRVGTLLAHERVHVLQHDFALTVWSAPLQREIASRLPPGGWGAAVDRHVEVGLHFPVWRGLNELVPYATRPWEREAFFLSKRTGPTERDGPVLLH